VYAERQGVSRASHHPAITFLRALNVPARYATGYLGDIGVPRDPNPMDFSAWLEGYLGGARHRLQAHANAPPLRPPPPRAPPRPPTHGPRPRCGGRGPPHVVRGRQPHRLHRLDGRGVCPARGGPPRSRRPLKPCTGVTVTLPTA